ncbi:MAG: tetratricopeptide repeat protein [Betaproteobacteria bacterium]|nr:tetratricopeptide repeat protein [Betaproteobacteria bacterium]
MVPEPLLAQFSGFLAARIGLHFPRERWDDLERGINAAARDFRFGETEACIRWLMSSTPTRSQIEILASQLTVGETYFFRERRTFDTLEQSILPELIRSRRGNERRLRIWSAGCCTGEEPYSIAILLARTIPDWRDWNISILATDINPHFLRKASIGVYGAWSFRDTPAGIKAGFFRRTTEGRFEIHPAIKALVTFAYLNLAEDGYPSVENGSNAMDIIFCRNVVMYFEPERGRKVIQNLGLSLMDDGWLFVSAVEVSQVVSPQLRVVNFPGAIVYRRSTRWTTAENDLAAIPPWAPVAPNVSAGPANLDIDEEPVAALPPGSRQETGRASRPERKQREVDMPAHTPYRQASALYEHGRYSEAAEATLGLLSRDPNDAKAMALLARIYANQGRIADAFEWCDKAVAADKLNPGWCYLLATILQEQGRPDDAVAALKRALYLDQNHALAHVALGNLTRRRGKLKESERHFRNALSILRGYRQEHVLPESEGVTAGRLAEIIQSTISSEAWT